MVNSTFKDSQKFMKGKFDALAKRVQNWIVDWFTAHFTIHIYLLVMTPTRNNNSKLPRKYGIYRK